MKWVSTLVEHQDLQAAVDEASIEVLDQLKGRRADLVVVFVSHHHRERYDELLGLLPIELKSGAVIGCSAGGVIGDGHEVEQRPALSLTAAHLPRVKLTPFRLDDDMLPVTDADAGAWERLLGITVAERPQFILLPDPFSCNVEALLGGLDRSFPDSRKIGGLASGGDKPGAHALYLGEQIYRSGAVGIALSGNIRMDTLVAQGCRPIGEPLFVTAARRNVLLTLDGNPPVSVLGELYERLSERDRGLLKQSLFLGIAMRDECQEYRQGDFLIRNIIGLDQDSGAMAVGAIVPENSVVQFHLRDAKTSAEDLEALLRHFRGIAENTRPRGALLFSCLGRGRHLYGAPDHDTDAFRHFLGDIPLGGFFCNGEIGPVQGATFLHGYTSAFGLFGSEE